MQRSTVLRCLYSSRSKAGGLPPRLPRRRRWPRCSAGTGIVARMPRLLRCSRMARDEYALSARTASGRVRGRPRHRGTRRRAITSAKAGASPACPAVRWSARGRQLPSAARWIFVVSPSVRHGTDRWHGHPARRPGPLFAGSGRHVLMGSHDRGVHRDDPVQLLVGVCLGHRRGERPLPRAISGPYPQPVVDAPPVCRTSRAAAPTAPLSEASRRWRRSLRGGPATGHPASVSGPEATARSAPTARQSTAHPDDEQTILRERLHAAGAIGPADSYPPGHHPGSHRLRL